MKRIAYIAAAVSVMACAAPVFAQDVPATPQQAAPVTNDNSNTNSAANSGVGMDVSGQTAAGSPADETRQDVEQQLYQAETDGQLKTLNHTVYNGN
ncbi:MAG: hypothetical protein AB1704_03215 [Pseudomonadota bacterium]|jgi:hypothetical protein|uniref:hypothetical protein n=1 Tax=Burkholderiaceae TaxID=119060 RepID=UPI0010F885B8|nr:hypothetical protein [Burkholderia sp. 4M9327F10]